MIGIAAATMYSTTTSLTTTQSLYTMVNSHIRYTLTHSLHTSAAYHTIIRHAMTLLHYTKLHYTADSQGSPEYTISTHQDTVNTLILIYTHTPAICSLPYYPFRSVYTRTYVDNYIFIYIYTYLYVHINTNIHTYKHTHAAAHAVID